MTDEPKYVLASSLEQDGKLIQMVKAGFCDPCILTNLEMYRYVDARIKTGSTKMQAVMDAEVAFKVCEKTVYNRLKYFK